jgi:hypothetical protein
MDAPLKENVPPPLPNPVRKRAVKKRAPQTAVLACSEAPGELQPREQQLLAEPEHLPQLSCKLIETRAVTCTHTC